MRSTDGARAAWLAALGAAALWGTTGTAQALGPADVDPVSVGAARIAVGATMLLLLALPRGAAPRGASAAPPLLSRTTLPLLLLGGLAVAAYQACFFVGVARTGVAIGTVVAIGLAPVATGLLGLTLGERLDRRWVLATAAAVTGVAVLVAGAGGGTDGVDPLGVAAAVGAGLSYAGYTIAARALLVRGVPGMRVVAGVFTIGALVLAPVLVLTDLSWLVTARGLGMVLWLGVVATAFAYVLFSYGLSRLSAGTVATLTLAEPVTAALLGVIVLGERLSGLSLLGILVVVAGLALLAIGGRRPVMESG